MSQFSLGLDIGSSCVKASLLDIESGSVIASAFSPATEMPMIASRPGWAEQDPEMWWEHVLRSVRDVIQQVGDRRAGISCIGISYQMHGLVVLDKNMQVLRPSIIWCDSRAVEIGNRAFDAIGRDICLSRMLNSPGNFTASKLRWVRENEPPIYARIKTVLLPGDYIALRLTGQATTTASGLSEGILWDFTAGEVADVVLKYYDIAPDLIASRVPTFGDQGTILPSVAEELGLPRNATVTYRAGDQPNNALSLNVLEPGEIASTAGTSGVVYGVTDAPTYDKESRVNSFVHVNHESTKQRIGVLLCINGTGIANSWMRNVTGRHAVPYAELNTLAEHVAVGSDGLVVLPFGNGAERMLANRDIGAHVRNVQFNRHTADHLVRATHEGIACSLAYGMNIMRGMGMHPTVLRAGKANMFQSPIVRETLAATADVRIELYNTDGAQGAARGAAFGAGLVRNRDEMYRGLRQGLSIAPNDAKREEFTNLYRRWLSALKEIDPLA